MICLPPIFLKLLKEGLWLLLHVKIVPRKIYPKQFVPKTVRCWKPYRICKKPLKIAVFQAGMTVLKAPDIPHLCLISALWLKAQVSNISNPGCDSGEPQYYKPVETGENLSSDRPREMGCQPPIWSHLPKELLEEQDFGWWTFHPTFWSSDRAAMWPPVICFLKGWCSYGLNC